MERFTVILVPDRTSRVRRFQFPRRLVRRAIWIAAIAAVVQLAGTIDYVRLRFDAIEVGRLRSEAAEQREQIATFASEMAELEERLARLRELERKVRIMANLPKAVANANPSDPVHPQGRGGGVEEENLDVPPGATPPPHRQVRELSDPFAGVAAAEERPEYWPRPEVVARLHTRAKKFREIALNREASFEDLIDGLQGKSHRLASTPSIWPTRGWVTSGFGRRISPFTGRPQFHAGIDVAASFGTDVVAPGRGRVAFAGRKGAMGRTLTIEHGYGVRTTYGHLASLNVRKGQEVERGEVIATIGSSGRSTGPHLHYALVVNGKAVNPIDYIFE